MKKLFVISIMLVATVTFAAAQQRQRQTAEERAKTHTDRMVDVLKLTADQKAKIQAIDLELSKQLSAQMQNNQGNRESMRTAMQEIEKKRDEKYKPVLTADQFKKYLADKEQRQKEMEARRAQRNN